MGWLGRIYRLRPRFAVLVCAPALLLCAWYAWDAFARLDEYRRATGRTQALTWEQFEIALHDGLVRDLRRLALPQAPTDQRLKQYRFQIDPHQWDRLLRSVETPQDRPYVPARLVRKRRSLPVHLRLRGQRHWHVLAAQRSLKVRFDEKPSDEGVRSLGLINDPTPLVIGEPLVAELAAEAGLLVPGSEFARVFINGADLGVYRRQDQADEALLRSHRRFPCSLYSGDLPHGSRRNLWRDASAWKKAAWCSGQKQDRADLERLLQALRSDDQAAFFDFARHELDLTRFAKLEALEIAFGIDQRDERQGHKLVFDPYRVRWEPVAWSLRGFAHRPEFDLADHPLGLRLKYLPGYLAERNRILYQLLIGPASPASVRRRGLGMLKTLLPELASDPFWDAYKLLPKVGPFEYRMVRPMNVDRLGLAFEAALATLAERQRFLLERLGANPLTVVRAEPEVAGLWPLRFVIAGQSGVALESIAVRFAAGCTEDFRLLRQDQVLAGQLHAGRLELDHRLALPPVVRLVSRPGAAGVQAEPTPVDYVLSIRSACRPEAITVVAIQSSTGSRVRIEAQTSDAAPPRPKPLGLHQVPGLGSGEVAASAWAFDPPVSGPVVLGPGRVEIDADRIFAPGEPVRIEPGTRLVLAPDVSLVFLGPVDVQGTEDRPVVVEGRTADPFGGLVLQGPATAGSRLHHLVVRGGSSPRYRAEVFPGTVSIHDTRRIRIEGLRLEGNVLADDFLHAAYVEGLDVDGLTVVAAAGDAIDLEFVQGRLQDVRVAGAGDEALDLMGADVELIDAILDRAGGNAVSAGERSHVRIRGSLLSRSSTGLASKHGSRVELSGCLLAQDAIGVRLGRPGRYYPEPSVVSAGALFLVGCQTEIEMDSRDATGLVVDRILRRLPRDNALGHLRREVLRLDDWDRLDARLETFSAGEAP